jgi:hypothetical protein
MEMPWKNPEDAKAYREANKARIAARKKVWYERNKEAQRARSAQYRLDNPERAAAATAAWREANPEAYRRAYTIRNWRAKGVVSDDFGALYNRYVTTEACEDCGVTLTAQKGDGQGTFRVLDHCHDTGETRGIVCSGCNNRRF